MQVCLLTMMPPFHTGHQGGLLGVLFLEQVYKAKAQDLSTWQEAILSEPPKHNLGV